MNWPIALADLLVIVAWVAGSIWWMSAKNAKMAAHEDRIKELEFQSNRARDHKHDVVNPKLQELDWRLDHLERNGARPGYRAPPAPSYTDLDDSRVTSDPRKEPVK